nr:putative 3C [Enterovirus H]
GPSLDFSISLLRHNIRTATTVNGEFTMLGIYDRVAVLPSHAGVTDTILVDGKTVPVVNAVNLVDPEGVNLEITVLTLGWNEKFRDIRKFIPETVEEGTEGTLIVQTSNYPHLICPIGTVKEYGYLNLSGTPTHRVLMYNFHTRIGQCGGVIATTGRVLGIHVGGNGAQGFAASLFRKYFAITQ